MTQCPHLLPIQTKAELRAAQIRGKHMLSLPPTIQASRNDQHLPQLLEKHIYLLTPLSSFPLKQPKSLSW